VITDHNPLVHLPTQPNLSGRQVRWSEYLQRFDFNWVYRPGVTNLAANALSRNPPERSPFCVVLLMALTTRSQAKNQGAAPAQSQPKHIPKKAQQSNPDPKDSSPGGPGVSQGGEEPHAPIEASEPSKLQHTRLPEGTLDIYEEVRTGYENNPWFQNGTHTAHYTLKDGLWWTKVGQLIVPDLPVIKRSIISEMHDPPLYGHP